MGVRAGCRSGRQRRTRWGKGEDGEGEPAGWRGGEDGGGRGDALGKSRWGISAGLAGPRRRSPSAPHWTARPAGVSPCTHLGAPAPNPVPCSGSSFPPCPSDFSAPESRSLGQVPPAASSPRGTPGATPLLGYHWLAFMSITFPLAEWPPGMQIRRARRRADWLVLAERSSLTWALIGPAAQPKTVTRRGFLARARGAPPCEAPPAAAAAGAPFSRCLVR